MAISKIGSNSLNSALTFTGQQTIPTINLTGGQITFPATQVPSSDANTLDDYEEGTYSAALPTSPVNMSGTGTMDQTLYTKVGRLVTVSGRVTGLSVTSSNTLTYPVISIPFPMTSNIITINGSALMNVGSTYMVGGGVDNSSGDATQVALVFPAATITATGSATVWFSITYSSAA